MSCQPCGCDSDVAWLCQVHAQEAAEKEYLRMQSVLTEAGNLYDDNVEPLAAVPALPKLDDLLASEDWLLASAPAIEERIAAFKPAELEGVLRVAFPYGHKQYLPIAIKQLMLHSEKNHDYASGGSALGNFERVSAILGQYPNLKLSDPRVIALVYALKQLDAVLWGINSNIQHKVEGLDSRLDDIAVYATIVQCMNGEVAK